MDKLVKIVNPPTYVSGQDTVKYRLLGFSTDPSSQKIVFRPEDVVVSSSFAEGETTIELYAVWESGAIIRFASGISSVGSMD